MRVIAMHRYLLGDIMNNNDAVEHGHGREYQYSQCYIFEHIIPLSNRYLCGELYSKTRF
jgi:hypothetical protein